jgi:hypothetical protein
MASGIQANDEKKSSWTWCENQNENPYNWIMNGMEVYTAEINPIKFLRGKDFQQLFFSHSLNSTRRSRMQLSFSRLLFHFSNDKLNGFWLDNKCLRTWKTKCSVFSRKLFLELTPSLINNFRHETVNFSASICSCI